MGCPGVFAERLELEALSRVVRAPVHVFFCADGAGEMERAQQRNSNTSAAAGAGGEADGRPEPSEILGVSFKKMGQTF